MKVLSCIFFMCVLAATTARSEDLTPYLEGTEHRITEREYSDLRSYIERAQEILTQTLNDSTAYSGTELRNQLLRGMRAAQQSTNLRNELLLFQYILTRALEIDRLYTYRYDTAEGAQLSAQNILLPAIELALAYYQSSDLPRLATTTVPSPDWILFAADQVPHLLRAVDLAPNQPKKVAVVKRALGWTAKALNSAIERRGGDVAKHIVRLGEIYNDPNSRHPHFVTRAQDALLSVYKSYRKPLPTITLAPASAGVDLKMRRKSWSPSASLPLFNSGRQTPLAKEKWEKAWNETQEEVELSRAPDQLIRVNLLLGAGIAATYDGNEAGEIGRAKAITFESDAVLHKDHIFDNERDGPSLQLHGALAGNLRAAGKIGDWTYQTKAEIALALGRFVGGYLAVERNVFERFEESLVTAGFAPSFIIRVGKAQYVLIRPYVGVSAAACNVKGVDAKKCEMRESGNTAAGGAILVRLKRFAAALNVHYMHGFEYDGDQRPDRVSVDASVTLPLGVIVRNDALHLKASTVTYTGEAPGGGTAMMFYGWKW